MRTRTAAVGAASIGLATLLVAAASGAAGSTDAPTMAEGVWATLHTEQVEPGVVRVIDDGVRDVVIRVAGYPGAFLDIAADGGIWLSTPGSLYRLGDEASYRVPELWPPYLAAAPDGSLWGIGTEPGDTVQSFDGQAWTAHTKSTDQDVELWALGVAPDGTVWVVASDQRVRCGDPELHACQATVLLWLDDGSLLQVAEWADLYAGDVAPDEVAVSPDGDVWLIAMERWDGPGAQALLRFDGREWALIPGPDGFVNHPIGRSMAIGPDGTVWVHTDSAASAGSDRRVGSLARFDDPGWTVFTEDDGAHPWGGQGFIATDLLGVSPDGSFWMNGAPDMDRCGGLVHFDGTTWTSYLRHACIHDTA